MWLSSASSGRGWWSRLLRDNPRLYKRQIENTDLKALIKNTSPVVRLHFEEDSLMLLIAGRF